MPPDLLRGMPCLKIGRMHFLISPAKTLDYDRSSITPAATRPRFLAQSAELIDVLRPKTSDQVAELMSISPALAELYYPVARDIAVQVLEMLGSDRQLPPPAPDKRKWKDVPDMTYTGPY